MIDEMDKIDFRLHLLYGNKTEEDILMRKELDEFNDIKHIDVSYTLSREQKNGFLHGRID